MGQQWQGSAAVLVAAALASSPLPGMAAGGGGDPVFKLNPYKLDNAQFWIIFAGMIFYGLLIDRVQYFTQQKVANNRCNKMIFDRVVTEFMVFGIVAITIFVGTNLDPYLDDRFPSCVTHLTYADVLVSFAACSLIGLGALYSWMRYRSAEHLQGFEGQESIPKMGTWQPMNLKQQSVFFERNKLTSYSFNWNMYFQESLAHQICDLINITWVTWLVTFIVLLPMVFFKSFIGTDPAKTKAQINGYINGYLFATWCFSSLTLATVVIIRVQRGKLYAAVDRYLKTNRPDDVDSDSEDEDSLIEDLESVEEKMRWWSDFSAWLMQFLSLIDCFLLGMYVMHIAFNLQYYEKKGYVEYPVWCYHVGFLVPLVLSLVVLFPMGLIELTSIQAFSTPDMDVLHSIVSEVRQAHTDLCFIQTKIMSQGGSSTEAAQARAKALLLKANDDDDTVKRMDLMSLLVSIDVHLTTERAFGVFDLVDQEHEAKVQEHKSLALKVRNCFEDAIDVQVPIDDLLDSALKAKMDGKQGKTA